MLISDRLGTARKRLGQFYTPVSEAASVARWAIRTGSERILEPSVGDGALLAPALARAAELTLSLSRAVACDIDTGALAALGARLGDACDLISADFFDLDPRGIGPVDVVLANPPFTRNHAIPADMRRRLRARFAIKGAAGLWAYFILHSRQFLRPGGRMAVIVPAAAGFALYADGVLQTLRQEFHALGLYDLPTQPDWVGGANERGALLIADGYQTGAAAKLERGVWSYESDSPAATSASKAPATFTRLMEVARPFSSIAKISIGVVTGANRVFLLDSQEAYEAGIDVADLVPIVTRARQIKGLTLSRCDILGLASGGEKTWLLAPRELGPRGGAIRKRLALIGPNQRRSTRWLNKRHPWWRVQTIAKCDAVFTYMNDLGPRLSLVDGGIQCTNTLHSVAFLPTTDDTDRWAAVLSMICTAGQLSAELLGRVYGGGILKLELRETRNLPIFMPDRLELAKVRTVDKLLRAGSADQARELADQMLLAPFLGRRWGVASRELQAALEGLRATRRRLSVRSLKDER